MSSLQVGANLEQLRHLSQRFEARAADVEGLVADLGALIGGGAGAGSVFWQGQVADRFRQEWDQVYVRNLRELTEALRHQSRLVDEHRRRSNLALNGIDA